MLNIFKFLTILLIIFTFSTKLIAEDSKKVQASNKFKLGVIVPLSGDLAFFGNAHTSIEKLIREDLLNSKNIEIIYEDSGYDTKKALNAYHRLVTIHKVDAVYSFGGPMLSALAPIAEKDKIPFFAPESEGHDIAGKKYVNLFRNETTEFGQIIWKVLREKGVKNLGIVKNRNQFMDTFVKGIIETANNNEKVEVLIEEDPGTSDFRTQITKLKNKQIDMLGVFLLPGSHRSFLSQTQELGFKIPAMLGVEEFLVPSENKGLENLIESTLIVTPYVPEDFRTRYINKFKNDAGIEYGVEFYMFLELLNETIKDSTTNNIISKEHFLEAMHFKGTKKGLGGSFSLKETKEKGKYYSFPIAIYKIENNKVVVEKVFDRID